MLGSPDESIREVIWIDENKVIACSEHQSDFIGKEYVIKIEKIRYPIECGFKTCNCIGVVEIQLRKDNSKSQFEESLTNQTYELSHIEVVA